MSRGDGKAGLRREVVANLTRSIKLFEQSTNLKGVAQEMCHAFNLNFDALYEQAVAKVEKGQGEPEANAA